jgi:mono/diheme cytochrome c family protein
MKAIRTWLGLAGVVLLGLPSLSASQAVPNLERGRTLYENHCIVCHTPKVHRRVPSLPLRVEDLRTIVSIWATHQGLRWNQEEIEDVVYYLDRVHYRFEK